MVPLHNFFLFLRARSQFFLFLVLVSLLPFLLSRHFIGRPEYSRTFFRRGCEYLEQHDRQRARRYLKRAILQDPGNAKAHLALAKYYEEQGENILALGYLARSVAIDPDLDQGYYHLGSLFLNGGHYDQAAEAFQKAIHVGGNYGSLGSYHFALSRCYLGKGQKALVENQIQVLYKVDRPDLALKLQKILQFDPPVDRN